MLRFLTFSSVFIFLVLVGVTDSANADQKLFTELKCNKCHTITSLGIEMARKGGDDDDDDDSSKNEHEDLSSVGTRHNADFLKKWLMKETVNTDKSGAPTTKKHKVKFKGTDAQVGEMATWLASLKK